ncbi:MAG: Trm112 family protein [Candidatus Omnitrophota bacterium]|nr:Trm112 family protein [Candidatus Omnitrophota bacterium]
MVDKKLLDILACPLCKADVRLEGGKIVCSKCARRYPIKDDIPIMLIDEAETPEKV